MSEHKAAAHIHGFYLLLAALVGLVGGYYLKSATDPPQGQKPPVAAKAEPVLPLPNIGKKVDASEAKPAAKTPAPAPEEKKPERLLLSMKQWFDLLDNPNTPPSEITKHIGKEIVWTGHYDSIGTFDDFSKRCQMVIDLEPTNSNHRVYCYCPDNQQNKDAITEMRPDYEVTFSGILDDKDRVTDCQIVQVLKYELPKPEKTNITLVGYKGLLENKDVPTADVERFYNGKEIKWTVYYHSMSSGRVTATAVKERFRDYVYCYFPDTPKGKEDMGRIHPGCKFTFVGVLKDTNDVYDCQLIDVEYAP